MSANSMTRLSAARAFAVGRGRARRLCSRAGVTFALAWAVLAGSASAADRVYWANAAGNKISFADLAGTGGGDLNTTGATVNLPEGIAVDPAAGRIYWANFAANKISFANLNGTGGGDLATTGATVSGPQGVAVDPAAGRIYWANGAGNKISFAKLDGSGGGDLTTTGATVSNPYGVAVDPAAGRIYWANYASNKISFANLVATGGGDLPTTGATVNHPEGVAVDPAAKRIYWANYDGHKISFASLDGSGGGDLNTTGATVNGPEGVAVDPAAGRIYWANRNDQKISFTNLDGTGGGNLPTPGATVFYPDFPALLKVPSATGAPSIAGGSAVGSTLTCSSGSWASNLLPALLYRAPRSLGLRWSLDGVGIAGAASNSITAASAGSYRCHVTAINQAGSATQASAPHAVSAPVPAAGSTPLTQGSTHNVLPRIDSTVKSRWAYDRKTGKRFTLLLLKVVSPPKGAAAQIRCSGKRCAFQSRRMTRFRNRAITLYKRLPYARALRDRKRRFRAGQLAELRITAPGYIGKVVRYKLKARRLPVGRVLCLTPGAARPSRCTG